MAAVFMITDSLYKAAGNGFAPWQRKTGNNFLVKYLFLTDLLLCKPGQKTGGVTFKGKSLAKLTRDNVAIVEAMTSCVERRPDEMESVIKGLIKTMPDSTPEDLLEALMSVIKKDWIGRVFDGEKFHNMKNKKDDLMFNAQDPVKKAFRKMLKNSNLKTKLMESISNVYNDEANIIQT